MDLKFKAPGKDTEVVIKFNHFWFWSYVTFPPLMYISVYTTNSGTERYD